MTTDANLLAADVSKDNSFLMQNIGSVYLLSIYYLKENFVIFNTLPLNN